jgi:hypothetical protein
VFDAVRCGVLAVSKFFQRKERSEMWRRIGLSAMVLVGLCLSTNLCKAAAAPGDASGSSISASDNQQRAQGESVWGVRYKYRGQTRWHETGPFDYYDACQVAQGIWNKGGHAYLFSWK